MLVYAFSFTIFVLTFLIGLFSVSLFILPGVSEIETQNVAAAKLNESASTSSISEETAIHLQTGIESLISDKEKALLLFEPTLRKWLKKETIAKVIEPSQETIERIAETPLHRYEAPYLTDRAQRSYKPSLIDLNGDGNPELAILINWEESYGGDLWIFREVKGDLK